MGNVCATPRTWIAVLALALSVIVSLALPVGVAVAAPAFAFEDRNNNGVFDGSDVDITSVLFHQGSFQTAASVVITGGPLRMPDPKLKAVGGPVGISIRAGKNITIESSILCPSSSGGSVDLQGTTVTVASGVTLDGRHGVSVRATDDVEVGDQVKITSRGGGANVGSATVSSTAGTIHGGSNFQISALSDVTLAAGGSISLEPGSSLSSTRGVVSLHAGADILADGTRMSAPRAVSLEAGLGADDMVSLRSSKVSVKTVAVKGGSISVSAQHGTIDVQGATFLTVTPELTAAKIFGLDSPDPPPPPPPPAGTEYLGPTVLPGGLGAHLDAEERVLLDLLNEIRAANGKPPFWAVSAKLTQAADWHSRDMFRTGSVSHTSSNGWDIGYRLGWFGWNNVLFSQPAGEIIYAGSGNRSVASAAAAVQWWMNSAPHRSQILTASYAHIGIGRAANADDTTAFWTVDFSGQSPYGTVIDGGVIRAWNLGFIDPDTP